VLYIELADRLGVKLGRRGLAGALHGAPTARPQGTPTLIDVFEGGKEMSRKEAEKLVEEFTGDPGGARSISPR